MRINFIIFSLFLVLESSAFAVRVGQEAPKLKTFRTYNGKSGRGVRLEDYRGRVVLLQFFKKYYYSTFDYLSHSKRLYNKYKDKGLTVIAITNEDSEGIDDLIHHSKIPFPVTIGDDSNYNNYKVEYSYAAIIIDPFGKVISKSNTYSASETTILKALKGVVPVLLDDEPRPTPINPDNRHSKLKYVLTYLNKGKVGSALSKLDKLLEHDEVEDWTKDAMSVKEHIEKWLNEQRDKMNAEIQKGDVYYAHKILDNLCDAIDGDDREKQWKDELSALKKTDEYKQGKEYYDVYKKIIGYKETSRRAKFASYAKKIGDTYYGKLAQEMSKR